MSRYLRVFFLIFIAPVVFAAAAPETDLRERAEAGSAVAQLALGTALLESESEADWAAGVRWLEKAARQGMPVYLLVADCYRDGIGVPRDLAQAAEWYRVGAETGDGFAQFELGRMYLGGEGVAQDMVRAVLYLQLAVDRLDDTARRREAEDALMQAKWWTSWEEWQQVKELLKSWRPKTLPELMN